MKDIKISIIIPVYNGEEHIENTFNSIKKQTLKDIEIIFIDDGSTDSSNEILTRYKNRFTNIKVFKQNNKGAGTARNLGIENAIGEFICFIDTDDFYVSEDALEYLYNLAKKENVNICGGNSCNYKNEKLSFVGLREERSFGKDQYVRKEDFPGMTGFWAYIYKRQFLIANKIFFPVYMRGQDLVFFARAISYSGGAYCSSKLVYAYRINHKKVRYDEVKALGIVSSIRDVFEISKKNNLQKIQQVVYEELKGEVGALIYKYSYEGSAEMKNLAEDFNLIDNRTLKDQLILQGEELDWYIQETKREKYQFLDRLKKIERIYIFGTGMTGKKVAAFLEKNQIKVNAYIVSNANQEAMSVDSIQVKGIEEIDRRNNDYIVILAAFWHSISEITELLAEKNIENVYTINVREFLLWQEVIEH